MSDEAEGHYRAAAKRCHACKAIGFASEEFTKHPKAILPGLLFSVEKRG